VKEGTADRSYGLQVARLAGVATSLLDRAYEMSNKMRRSVKYDFDDPVDDRIDVTQENFEQKKVIISKILKEISQYVFPLFFFFCCYCIYNIMIL
jgi:DNA mismatch repair ATPase MutS